MIGDSGVSVKQEPSSSRHALGARLLVSVVSALVTLGLVEAGLRLAMPDLSGVVFSPVTSEESPFRFDPRIGYELKPYGVIGDERMNSDGFRGPERAVPKPSDVYRLLAIGDSVVEATIGDVRFEQSWAARLERSLAAPRGAAGLRYEVINAGVGGYVSWQALARLQTRGLKYQPDLVIVLVGWGDLLYGMEPRWYPTVSLTDVPDARAGQTPWRAARRSVLRLSFVARLVHRLRTLRRPTRVEVARTAERRRAFNQAALENYVANMEKIRDVVTGSGATLAVVAFPTLLTRGLLEELQRSDTGPTLGDYADAIDRYRTAIRSLANRHSGVILIDAAEAFAAKAPAEQERLFVDPVHLSPEGNELLADIVRASLARTGKVFGSAPRGA